MKNVIICTSWSFAPDGSKEKFSKPFLILVSKVTWTFTQLSEIRLYILFLSGDSLLLQLPPKLATKIISRRPFIAFSMLPFHERWKLPKKEKKIITIKCIHHGWVNGDAWIPITVLFQSLHTVLKVTHFYIFSQCLYSLNLLLLCNFCSPTFDMNCFMERLRGIKISRMPEPSFQKHYNQIEQDFKSVLLKKSNCMEGFRGPGRPLPLQYAEFCPLQILRFLSENSSH